VSREGGWLSYEQRTAKKPAGRKQEGDGLVLREGEGMRWYGQKRASKGRHVGGKGGRMSAGSNPVVKNLGNRMESLGFCESEDLPAPFPDKRLAQACGQKRDVEQWFGGGLCLCGNIALTISHAVRQKRDSKGPQTQRWGGGRQSLSGARGS